MSSAVADKHGTPTMKRVLERLEEKCCPQGLHVILEELQWLGERAMTYDKLWHAVRTELRATHPRIRRVAEGVYWFAELDIPLGWSLFADRRMLPCFYRRYPPAISWEDIDLPENVLPSPGKPLEENPGLPVTHLTAARCRKGGVMATTVAGACHLRKEIL